MLKRFAVIAVASCSVPMVSASGHDFEQLFGKVDGDGIKVCSAVVGGDWRNDLIVPQSWELEDCMGWAAKIGGAHNRACLHAHFVEYEPAAGWNSCGWH